MILEWYTNPSQRKSGNLSNLQPGFILISYNKMSLKMSTNLSLCHVSIMKQDQIKHHIVFSEFQTEILSKSQKV